MLQGLHLIDMQQATNLRPCDAHVICTAIQGLLITLYDCVTLIQPLSAGLRLAPGAIRLTRAWIVYNKPASPTYTHAGMLMGLGLNGEYPSSMHAAITSQACPATEQLQAHDTCMQMRTAHAQSQQPQRHDVVLCWETESQLHRPPRDCNRTLIVFQSYTMRGLCNW